MDFLGDILFGHDVPVVRKEALNCVAKIKKENPDLDYSVFLEKLPSEIERCKAEPRTDPASCERRNADYGAAVRTINGGFTPRMFHDIPPCVEADEERRRRR